MTPIPEGFDPIQTLRASPFLEHVGPFFARRHGTEIVLGLQVLDTHLNARGMAHGGVLTTMADVALGDQRSFLESPPARLITVSMSIDFVGGARLGDWVEAHVEVVRLGARMGFANAYLTVAQVRIARASAVFVRAAPAPEQSD